MRIDGRWLGAAPSIPAKLFDRSAMYRGLTAALIAAAAVLPLAARAQSGNTNLAPEPSVFDQGPGGTSRKGGSLLDSTNPIDLMNKLRRSSAMDDATDPGDAIDAALRQLDSQPAPPSSGASSPLVTAP
ncbi:hypothetical protein [Synechococcus sp. NB0720_010]|uniref:hypothetical protein n=1 Tax=Synechococcus sp. NB0720_010 TaxID=2907159 RepID=UPI001FF97BE3|nr:hypothetical protein [Synechococcus sp. NB0720_010]UPH89971.1 hypothetical protein LY254_12025 [Synechococcus sp. NB0720_010]